MAVELRLRFVLALLATLLFGQTSFAEPFLVRDLFPGTQEVPALLALLEDRSVSGQPVYFLGSDPAHGEELWRTDGTAAAAGRLTRLGSFVYFWAQDGLWQTFSSSQPTTAHTAWSPGRATARRQAPAWSAIYTPGSTRRARAPSHRSPAGSC